MLGWWNGHAPGIKENPPPHRLEPWLRAHAYDPGGRGVTRGSRNSTAPETCGRGVCYRDQESQVRRRPLG